jgi:hypothetical protein
MFAGFGTRRNYRATIAELWQPSSQVGDEDPPATLARSACGCGIPAADMLGDEDIAATVAKLMSLSS